MSLKTPTTFDYYERSKIKEAVEANFHDQEFVAIVRDTIFGRKKENEESDEGEIIDFNRMEDEMCLRLYNAITSYGIQIKKTQNQSINGISPSNNRLVKSEDSEQDHRRKEREKARKAPIRIHKPVPVTPTNSTSGNTMNQNQSSSSKRQKLSNGRTIKSSSKYKENEMATDNIAAPESTNPVCVPNRMSPSDKVRMRRVLAHVQGIRRFAAASVLKWEKPKSGSMRGSCLIMFDFDRSLQWISVAAAPRSSGRGPQSTIVNDIADLHAPAVSSIYTKAHSDALLRLPPMSIEVGTGDSVSMFNEEGELDEVASAITPQQCKSMLKLLRGLDHMMTYESRIVEIENMLNSGKFQNALEFIIALRRVIDPITSEEVLDSLVITSVMEGYWTDLLKDAVGGTALRGDRTKKPSSIRIKNSRIEWRTHNEMCVVQIDNDEAKESTAESNQSKKNVETEENDDVSDASEVDQVTGNEVVVAQKTGRIVWAQTDVCPGWWPAETCVPDKDGMSLVKPSFSGRFFMVLYFANIEGGEAQTWDPLMASCVAPFSLEDLEEKLLELPNTSTDPEGACFLHMLKRGRQLGLDIPPHYREQRNINGDERFEANNIGFSSEEEFGDGGAQKHRSNEVDSDIED